MSGGQPAWSALANARALPLAALPRLTVDGLQQAVLAGVAAGQRVVALFGVADPGAAGRSVARPSVAGRSAADPPAAATTLYAVLADDDQGRLHVGRAEVAGESFPALTSRCPQVHLFEREIAEQFGLRPEGHPWCKPVRWQRSFTGRDAWQRPASDPLLPAVGEFFRVEGEELHEVAVGPVHAGVIEPGHFRFQCHGEHVFHLEIALGYQHRGVEQALVGGPDKRSLHYAETLAGDSTIAHATAHCQVLEALAGCRKTARAQTLRAIALELERLANHIGDLGALAADIGFQPTSSACGRLRGDALNMTAQLCGNRFGRGLLRPGGVGFDLDEAQAAALVQRLDVLERELAAPIDLLWDTPSVMARFEDTGPLPKDVAAELGIVGPAARASGLQRDVRRDQPSGLFRLAHIPVATCETGDVFARAFVRSLEIQRSLVFVREQLGALPGGPARVPLGALMPDGLAVSLEESWRGEVCHVALTDAHGRLLRYKVVDPSFHNWSALAHVMRGQEISDFPLCNKSFNLSYCGHDL